MDNLYDNNIHDISEDNIRPPDRVRTERLVEDTRSEFDKQLDKALYLSLQQIKAEQELYEQYEKNIFEQHIAVTNQRKEQFTKFLFDLNKLIRFDNEVREIYEILEPIIESYCDQYFDSCKIDEITFNKIFNIIKKIRTDSNAVEILKTIIIIDN